jgi:hypothetical protein
MNLGSLANRENILRKNILEVNLVMKGLRRRIET